MYRLQFMKNRLFNDLALQLHVLTPFPSNEQSQEQNSVSYQIVQLVIDGHLL
jgi:hypothetical protein